MFWGVLIERGLVKRRDYTLGLILLEILGLFKDLFVNLIPVYRRVTVLGQKNNQISLKLVETYHEGLKSKNQGSIKTFTL